MARLITRLTPFVGILVFLLVWEAGVALFKPPPYLLPGPTEIFHTFVREFARLAFHGWVTLYEMLLGYALAVVIAIPLAIAITSSDRFDRFTMPTLLFFQVVGMNSIFIYLFFEIVGDRWFNGYITSISSGLLQLANMPLFVQAILSSLCVFALEWGLCYFLYKRKIFFKL